MNIKIINYHAIGNPMVQAFVDVEVDWVRFIGLNLMRDGSLRAAQLKGRSGTGEGWRYFPAVVVPDDTLRELVAEEILAAIRAHIETLPPERRMKPPRPPEPERVRPPRPPAVPKAPAVAVVSTTRPASVKTAAGKKALAPPVRLLATRGGRP